MDINKAIKKQNKSCKRFIIFMVFMFFLLPSVMFLSRQFEIYIVAYLIIIEILIFKVIVKKIDGEYLVYRDNKLKFFIKSGILKSYSVICEKIALVDVENAKDDDWHIVVITKSKFRNKYIREVTVNFLKKHKRLSPYYIKEIKNNADLKYFYFIIKRGKLKKYELLNELYRSCTKATFTTEAIERIKEYREYIE